MLRIYYFTIIHVYDVYLLAISSCNTIVIEIAINEECTLQFLSSALVVYSHFSFVVVTGISIMITL